MNPLDVLFDIEFFIEAHSNLKLEPYTPTFYTLLLILYMIFGIGVVLRLMF